MGSNSRSIIRSRALVIVAVLLVITAIVLGYLVLRKSPAKTDYAASADAPGLHVTTVISGLDHPWDIVFAKGAMIFSQRDTGDLWAVPQGESKAKLILPKPKDLWVSGETGMMALAEDGQGGLYTCSGWIVDGKPEVRVNRWNLSSDLQVTFDHALVTGLPATSGRHGGCALELTQSGFLYIGTGDAADERNSQDITSGGGKVLRVWAKTGQPAPQNPFVGAGGFAPLVYSYGHRNVQGLAVDPQGRGMFTAEQGSNIDDEVNVLSSPGLNFGWNPGPDYDESGPMTDHSLPGSVQDPVWSSGDETIATSGIAWLPNDGWGKWNGGLVLGNLKDQSLRVLMISPDSKLERVYNPGPFQGTFGRLRNPVISPYGDLYLTTDNGQGNDKIIRVSPVGEE